MLVPALIAFLALCYAQSETASAPAVPLLPTSTNSIPTVEGSLIYDGPSVQGYTGPGGNATIQSNLPQATYVATLPTVMFDNATGSTISGTFIASTNSNGTGVLFTIALTGFPSVLDYGPFVYHIHNKSLDSAGNCTTALAHLDPTLRGELHACEVTAPQTCQAGDLAGKHGNITGPTFNAQFVDNYLSTTPNSPYFFGNTAIVIHSNNATRLTCANFTLNASANSTGGAGDAGGASTGVGSGGSPTTTISPGGPIQTASGSTITAAWFSTLGGTLIVAILLL